MNLSALLYLFSIFSTYLFTSVMEPLLYNKLWLLRNSFNFLFFSSSSSLKDINYWDCFWYESSWAYMLLICLNLHMMIFTWLDTIPKYHLISQSQLPAAKLLALVYQPVNCCLLGWLGVNLLWYCTSSSLVRIIGWLGWSIFVISMKGS